MKGKVDTYGHCQSQNSNSQETRVVAMVATAREILSKQILLVALKYFLMREKILPSGLVAK